MVPSQERLVEEFCNNQPPTSSGAEPMSACSSKEDELNSQGDSISTNPQSAPENGSVSAPSPAEVEAVGSVSEGTREVLFEPHTVSWRAGVVGAQGGLRRLFSAVATVLAAALTVFTLLGTSAFAYDKSRSERIVPGVSVANVPIGGLTREEARAALAAKVAKVSARNLYLTAAGRSYSVSLSSLDLDPRIEESLDRAFGVGKGEGILGRLHRWLGRGGPAVDLPLEVLPSRDAVERRVVASIAGEVNREPTDATIEETTDDIVFRPPSPGVELQGDAASDMVFKAALDLIEGRDPGVVRLPYKQIPVKEGAGITTAILVRVSQQRLYFYENASLAGIYKVSTGTPKYPTPFGRFRVVQKIMNPSWTNPAPDTWGKEMPPFIPPGPDNPLGTRALQLNAPGILIHGTQNVRALGSPASHGCIRMNMPEIEALYPRVPVGTPVFVRP